MYQAPACFKTVAVCAFSYSLVQGSSGLRNLNRPDRTAVVLKAISQGCSAWMVTGMSEIMERTMGPRSVSGVALATLLFAVGSYSDAFACSEGTRIPDLVERMRPQPVALEKIRELLPPMALRELVDSADLIVEGRIGGASTRLTKDQCALETEYSLVLERHVAGKVPLSAVPGPQQPIAFTAFGGTTAIDGVPVAMRDAQFPPFQAGQHVILFLQRSRSADEPRFRIVGEIEGAFAVEAKGRVRRLRDSHEPADFGYDAFVQQIKRAKSDR